MEAYIIYWLLGIVLVPGFIFAAIAQAKITSTYRSLKHQPAQCEKTADQVAREILDKNGLQEINLIQTSGELTDHYNPSTKVLNLSDTVYGSSSVAAIGVAAHECGHAIQHMQGYAPLKFRTAFVPVANIGSTLAWPIIILGVLINSESSQWIINAGIFLFSFAVIFQLLTLPVEFDASKRALFMLENQGILSEREVPHARKVLSAAALTYVASAAAAILQLLRVVILFGGRRRND